MDSNKKRVRFEEDDGDWKRAKPTENGNNEDEGEGLTVDLSEELERVKPKRGAVNLDGFGSEEASSDEETYKKKAIEKEEDDDDMFSDNDKPATNLDKNEDEDKPKDLDIDEIDGQEDFDLDGEEKTKVEAFNLKDDLEEGKFDAQGNFVWKEKDPDAIHDGWLQDISKSDIEKANLMKQNQQRATEIKTHLDLDLLTNDEVILYIISILKPKESVLNALARLGESSGRRNKNKNRKKSKQSKDEQVAELSIEEKQKNKLLLEQLTELADHLLSKGESNIYQDTYEGLVRRGRIAGSIADDWVPGTQVQID